MILLTVGFFTVALADPYAYPTHTMPTSELVSGESSDDIALLQERLIYMGLLEGKVTGFFGGDTRSAIKDFQSMVGFERTGRADEATLKALYGVEKVNGINYGVYFYTLEVGCRSTMVRQLQIRLKELGYFHEEVTGTFGEVTEQAVEDFQAAQGMEVTGEADPTVMHALFGDNVPLASPQHQYVYDGLSTSRTLKYGRRGSAVRDLQRALSYKGFYHGEISGKFDKATKEAVMDFQHDMNLKSDGLAGNYTLSAAFSVLAPPVEEPEPTSILDYNDMGIKKITWSEASDLFPRQSDWTVVDVNTGYVFHVRRTGGNKHADVEFITPMDSLTAYRMCDNAWSWDRRSIWVIKDGVRYAASMNCMPHGYDTLPGNDMRGQICIHFTGSKTHVGNQVDPDHKAAIDYAYELAVKLQEGDLPE